MKDDLLIRVDKAAMVAAIEAHVPYLDHTCVKWSFGILDNLAMRGGRAKTVLRAVAPKLLSVQKGLGPACSCTEQLLRA